MIDDFFKCSECGLFFDHLEDYESHFGEDFHKKRRLNYRRNEITEPVEKEQQWNEINNEVKKYGKLIIYI